MSPSLAGRRSTPPQILRVLISIAAELAPLFEQQAAARITLNISSGGHVRMEVAKFADIKPDEE
ncbi:MAG: hypothetical protein IPK16_25000 [Anaerolineales bacterium]|nr:hypothetical protein [Anaerolineales bacterium]